MAAIASSSTISLFVTLASPRDKAMKRLNVGGCVHLPADITRRDFLQAGSVAAGTLGLALTDAIPLQAGQEKTDVHCILLFLVGGPGQLDTWDLKPAAPTTVRGPFRPIRTNVPGIDICEHFPRMARMAHRYALVRSVTHRAPALHEIGHQAMQTGRRFVGQAEYPHYGAVLSWLHGPCHGQPPFVLVPGPIGYTGVTTSHGQGAASLGAAHEAHVARLPRQSDKQSDRYGSNLFGQSCLHALRLVELGTRLVAVNMFDTVFNQVTWDCHADGGSLSTRLDDYRTTLCPMFDRAYSALLDDLHQRGLLEKTLVVAMGEFGRTPYLNPRGGRDHWPGVWTVLFAGGGIRGGQVVGSSDRLGAEPKERPVDPAHIAATIYHCLGIDPRTRIPGPDGRLMPIVDADPVHELF